jgi:hypothetical protein
MVSVRVFIIQIAYSCKHPIHHTCQMTGSLLYYVKSALIIIPRAVAHLQHNIWYGGVMNYCHITKWSIKVTQLFQIAQMTNFRANPGQLVFSFCLTEAEQYWLEDVLPYKNEPITEAFHTYAVTPQDSQCQGNGYPCNSQFSQRWLWSVLGCDAI